ncbi:MAG: PhnD/SsuA/transferrin family substrate-binding protein [Hyphomicrobiales bacterium]|nr:PhnD/SsuA/transferrin family substrate-binding protein [Hyphomicrobiales bacterium]MCP5370188.1 PhnD/SsuA/transferrin family substrate-binding protein [Hyphomicrobiales bacterium]
MIRLAAGLLLVLLAAGQAAAADGPVPVRIAVLAFRGAENALNRWSPTADYLSARVPGHRFQILPLSLEQMGPALAGGGVDFVLTNTGNYVALEGSHGISRIATMRSPAKVEAGNVFGAVIFARRDRADIRALGDLKGKSFMGVQHDGFGGFQMAWRELKEAGIDPFTDFSSVTFSGFPQDEVAFAVRDGRVDAGTFRTGTLENMDLEGRIDMDIFRILAPKSYSGFPFLVSTRLYPEWPFAKLRRTDPELAQAVAIALLSMPADDPAAVAGNYGGWTVPLDYQPVHDLFRELRIGPYEHLGEITIGELVRQWGHWGLVILVILVGSLVWAATTERLVARRTRELSAANLELERQIAARLRAEGQARRRRAELSHMHRVSTMGEMASGLAHELNQPLAAIGNYARGGLRRLRGGGGTSDQIAEALERIAAQGDRAAAIIKRIRGMVRKDAPVRAPVPVSQVVREVAELMRAEAERQKADIELDLDDDLPQVTGDVVQVEQVLLNLIRNGLDAVSTVSAGVRRVTVRGRRAPDGGAVISVADNGPGLPDGAPGAVFDPFFTTKERGLGLGLSISQSIVQSHGGRLTARNGRPGAVFEFTLPPVPPAPEQDAEGRGNGES